MKQTKLFVITFAIAVVAVILPVALFAQQAAGDGAETGIDLGALFTNALALATFVVMLTEVIKKHVWKTMDGAFTVVSVFVLCQIISFAGYWLKLLVVTDVRAVAAYGISAFVMAIGGNLAMRKIGTGTLSAILTSTDSTTEQKK